VRIDAQRAFALGLVQEVVGAGRALDRALELAHQIASYPQAFEPTARWRWGRSGLRAEEEICWPVASEPELRAGLERYVSGDRPPAPLPA
jgi:enoyl-CoA hydratase